MSLKLENVSYTYGEKTAYEMQALKDINIQIEKGEFVGIIGHTGSGKSTLIQMMNGLEKPTRGRVIFHGQDIWEEGFDRKNLRSKVGLVFQYPEHQLFEVDVLSDVSFGPKNLGLSKEEAKERAIQALRMVGVPEKYYKASPFELSGGQKRRVAIAGVLAMEPEFLILDEPTAGLDPKGRDEILHQIAALHKEHGIAVLLVSHSMEDVANYVDRILVMSQGNLLYDDIPKHVFANYTELSKVGLAAPNVTYILHALKEKGLSVDTSVVTVEEAATTIWEALQKEGTKKTEE